MHEMSLITCPQKSTPTTETKPLDVNPISAYRSPGVEEGSKEGEKVVGDKRAEEGDGVESVKEKVNGGEGKKTVSKETQTEEGLGERKAFQEEELDEMAKKQGLMTDEDFQTLLDGVQKVERETAGMAEGLDLASPAVEGEIPRESADGTESMSTQPGAGLEEQQVAMKKSDQPGANVMPEKEEPKSAKRMLILRDDPRAEEYKSTRTSKRRLARKMMKKKGGSEASEMVEISSEEDGIPHDKRESEAANVAHEEMGSPTKPGENPQLAATESGAREDAKYPSSNHIGSEVETLTKPDETPTRIFFQLVQGADVEHQQSTPTSHEEPSGSRKEVSDGEDDEERYQLERKRKGKAPAKKKKSGKKPRVVQTAVVIREQEQTNRQPTEANIDGDYTSDKEPDSVDDMSLEDEEFQEQLLENEHRDLVYPPLKRIEYLA